jgi:hypothetical protein
VIDELGMEGYGVYWRLLEIVAEKLDAKGETFCQFSAKKWGNFFQFSPKKFLKFARILTEKQLIFTEISEKFIKIDIPNLLKYRDNYQKNLQASNNKVSLYNNIKEEEIELKEDKSSFCPEPENPAPVQAEQPEENAVEKIPLVDGTEYPITETHIAEFERAYPAVDVLSELRRIRAWCISNPQKRKTKKGCLRFVNSWLEKTQNRGGERTLLPAQMPRSNTVSQQRSQERQIMAKILLNEQKQEIDNDSCGNVALANGSESALPAGW